MLEVAMEALTKQTGSTSSAVPTLRLFDAILCGAKVTAFNPFKARVVPRVGVFLWSGKDIFLPVFFWPAEAEAPGQSDSLAEETDVDPFVERDPIWAATNVEPWARGAAVQVEDTSVPLARSAPAIVLLCDNTVLGDPVPGLLCDPVVGDAVLCGTKVTAFNPFKARVVVRAGALHCSCKDFLWPNFFGPMLARHSKSLSTTEKDVEDFVAPDSL